MVYSNMESSSIIVSILLCGIIAIVLTYALIEITKLVKFWSTDIDVAIECVPPIATTLVVLCKYINGVTQIETVRNVFLIIKNDSKRLANLPEAEVLHIHAMQGRQSVKSFIVVMYTMLVIYLTLPTVLTIKDVVQKNSTEERYLMYQLDYYFCDVQNYYFTATVHCYVASIIIISLVVSLDAMYITFIQHACAMFAVTGYKLKTVHVSNTNTSINKKMMGEFENGELSIEEQERVYEKFLDCVKEHNRVLECVQVIQSTFSTSLFMQISLNITCLSITGVQALLKMGQWTDMLRLGIWMAGQYFHLLFLYLPGQRLMDFSEQLFYDLLECIWYPFYTKSRMMYKFLVMKAAQPCMLTALKVTTLNMETFLSSASSYLDDEQAETEAQHEALLHASNGSPLKRPQPDHAQKSLVQLLRGMCTVWGIDYDDVIESMPPIISIFLGGSIYCNGIINIDKVRNVLLFIQKDCNRYKNRPESTILSDYKTQGRKIVIYYALYVCITLLIYLLVPTMPLILDLVMPLNDSRKKSYLFRVDYGVDSEEYYYYISVHSYMGTAAVANLIVSYDTMYMLYAQHAYALFAIVSYQLKTVHVLDEEGLINMEEERILDKYGSKEFTLDEREKLCKKLRSCIREHKNAIKYSDLLESLFMTSIFIQLFFNVLCLSLTGVQTVLKLGNVHEMMRFGTFTFAQTVHIFLICVPGQRLVNHSEGVYTTLCETMWYILPKKSLSLYMFLLKRSLVPSKITALKMAPMTMETFLSIIQTTMSYFTVLLSTSDDLK